MFLAAMTAAVFGNAPAQKPPDGTILRSLLEDLTLPSPGSPLAESDARANDRDWCHVNDFWTVNVADLYTIVSGATVIDTDDPAIKLIELSVASADSEENR